MAESLYLIDGHSMIYRAYYAPFRALTSPAGEPTRATYVFTRQLLAFIRKTRPPYLAMAIDGPIARLRRKQVFADYKASRKPMPSDLPPQVDRIVQLVRASGIPVLSAEGYEADDILATAVERLAGPDLRVVLISRDKDLDQLLDRNAVLYDPMRDETIDAAALQAAKGYGPSRAIDVQTLCGDDTDNIPGVPGVGPKTAARLVAQYGSADAVVAHASELTPKLSRAVTEHATGLAMSRQLVTLDRAVPIELKLDSLRFAGLRVAPLRPIFRELGFDSLVPDMEAVGAKEDSLPPAPGAAGEKAVAGPSPAPAQGMLFAPVPAATAADPGPTTSKDFDYRLVDTPQALAELADAMADAKEIGIDTETTSTSAMTAELVGISLSRSAGKAFYVPVKGPLGATVLPVEAVRGRLGPLLADPAVRKVGHNLKYDRIVLRNAGFPWEGESFDTMVAAYVLDATQPSYRLDALAAEFLNHRGTPIADLIGRGRNATTIDRIPVEHVTAYACEDADLALRIAGILEERLRDERLLELFAGLEMPLQSALVDMERYGVLVDRGALRALEEAFSKEADGMRDRLAAICGACVNPDSPRQLADVLFDKLKLPVLKKTSTGLPSTDESVLEQLAGQHELPALVLEYRRLMKLISTYLVALRECVNPRTGRVHTSFHQTATATGRLSSSDPNLQNIPIRTERGRLIRGAFVAAEGCSLLSADYSQVELRVLAHLCQDPTLMEAFHQDQDIHRTVAAEVFGVPLKDVTSEQRSRAKTVNFGIIYGQTAFGLSRTLGIGRGEAAEFIRAYNKRFPLIERFLRQCVAQAKERGHVETIFRRRRRIHGIESANPGERAAAERLAINSVVQGSAADLIKQAMVNIAARLCREGRPSRMLLQIHDELVFETPADHVPADSEMIKEEMSGAIRLRVPLKVDLGAGANWMAAK
jgi:DNA polymerase I